MWEPRKCSKHEAEHPSHQGRDDPKDIGAFDKGKGKGKHGKGKGKGKQGQQGQQGQDKSKDKDKDSIECWNCGKRGHYSKDCWSKKDTHKGGSKGKHKTKNATDAHNLDSTKPANSEPEVEIGGFDMSYLDFDAVEVREPEWIKIGVDTVAGKTAWPQSFTHGKRIPGDVDLPCTATGELVRSGKRLFVECCGVQLLSVGEYTTMGGVTVLYGDKGYVFHKGSNVAKKIEAWIQKDIRESQYHGCTVAYKENNVYNNYMKPRGNNTDAMPLSESSEGSRPGPPAGAGGALDDPM